MPFLKEPILIRLPNWVGDVCMSLPVLSLLETSGVPYSLCARPWAQELLSGLPSQSFIPITGIFLKDLSTLRTWHRNNTHYRHALLLPDSLSSALLFRLAGLQSAGYRDDGRSLLLSAPLDKPMPRPHAVQAWFNLGQQALERWGINAQQASLLNRLSLPLSATDTQAADAALAQGGLTAGAFVLIAPTATGLHRGQVKVWPHFAALSQSLQSQGLRVVMCPPRAEQADALKAAPSAEILPPLSLGAFAALTRLAQLVICNDSGVSHLSAAVNARQITLFGVTDPARTAPWTPDSVNLGKNGQWPALSEVITQVRHTVMSDQYGRDAPPAAWIPSA